MCFKEIGLDVVDRICMVQSREKLRAVVNTEMNLVTS